jgi:hypothetical protein
MLEGMRKRDVPSVIAREFHALEQDITQVGTIENVINREFRAHVHRTPGRKGPCLA